MKATIKNVAGYLPENMVYNHQVEAKITSDEAIIDKSGILRRLFGSEIRRFACENTQVSDLACEAARKVLKENTQDNIDLLIFAAASSDLIEPATANIIQTKLGLTCPVFDIKNACNSFVTAMQVASAFIESGTYDNILIVCGEKLSEVTNYHPENYEHYVKCLAGYTLGDAGAAMLMGKGDRGRIVYQKFTSYGKHWNLCTVKGGGSLAYRDLESYYFECDSKELQYVFSDLTSKFITDSLNEAEWLITDINYVISHQISSTTTTKISKHLGIPEYKFTNIFSKYGNIAAATIPMALSEAIEKGYLKRGDKLMLLGFAAGVSLSVQLIEW
ncbi:MAG TPA: ketoacyl-ACP synthase III [Lunatimonas sp.]|nr:ketoacyl-ACP synthase III [Lunatimonas sp.]